jgi:hypothetical protein
MDNKLARIVKTIGAKVRTNMLEVPHPALVVFGVSIAITIALAVAVGSANDAFAQKGSMHGQCLCS